jgi:hypothetical protein
MQNQYFKNHNPWLEKLLKFIVGATKEDQIHIKKENFKMWAKVAQVSNVAHGSFVLLFILFNLDHQIFLLAPHEIC